MLKLNLGCGTNLIPGWENHDADVDLRQPLPWPDGSAHYVLLEHVLEHFNSAVGYAILEECYRVLRPGGVLRICVPDVTRIAQADQTYADFTARNGWGSSPVKAIAQCHGHEMLWTYDSLAAVLRGVGFEPQRAEPRVSANPELCNIEGHHRVVGATINDIETLVVEATKREPASATIATESVQRAPTPVAPCFGQRRATGIVTAGDSNYFGDLMGLIDSVLDHRPDDSIGVHVMDVGLTSEQRDQLEARGASVIELGWDVDFPARAAAPSWFRALVARPFLPGHFPHLDLIIHLDADAWLQDWRAIELLCRGAQDGALAVAPTWHRSFQHVYEPTSSVRQAARRSYLAAFGEQVARELTWRPVFDDAVFALRANASLWRLWGDVLRDALSRSAEPMVARSSLNFAIATYAPLIHPLPQWTNWDCGLGLPMYDRETRSLVEPCLPYERISVVHQTTRRGQRLRLSAVGGGTFDTAIDYASFRTGASVQPSAP